MLTQPEEIKLVATAMEPGLRDPQRHANGPEEILRDFLYGVSFTGKSVIELGAGHYEFCEILRNLGAKVSAIELDPPIAELGRRRGFSIHIHNIRELATFVSPHRFDGLICKGSNNPFWFYKDRPALEAFTDAMTGLVNPGGWVWVVSCPWTKETVSRAEFNAWLEVEADVYRQRGYQRWAVPSRFVGGHYGISVPCRGLCVYTLGLPRYRWSAQSLLQLIRRLLTRGPAVLLRRVVGR
jgi:hypothetical protein